jgi:hypothetical protein
MSHGLLQGSGSFRIVCFPKRLWCVHGHLVHYMWSSADCLTSVDEEFMRFRQEAQYCVAISSQVFAETGFVPVLQRRSFDVKNGANSKSPISEMASRNEKLLWLRTDYFKRDDATSTPYKVAEFRRHEPLHIHWRLRDTSRSAIVFRVPGVKKDRYMYNLDWTVPLEQDEGLTYPAERTPCQIVVQVRLDGKAIEYPWARLPQLEIYKSFSQANSLAIRVEWEHPKGSGIWRFAYVQLRHNLKGVKDQTAPRPLSRWANAYATIHWIFNIKPDYTMSWMPKPFGAMRVLQINYDFMQQTIRFEVPQGTYRIAPCGPNSAGHIRNQMKTLQVDHARPTKAELKETAGKGGTGRKNCDWCTVLGGSTRIDAGFDRGCKFEAGETVCNNCKMSGFPICPWTLGLRSFGWANTAETKATWDSVYAALYASPLADMTKKTFRQTLKLLARDDGAATLAEDSDDEGAEGPEDTSYDPSPDDDANEIDDL